MHYWINAQPQASLAIDNRGLAYGDGVFETMRVVSNQIPLLALHQQRLFNALALLGIELSLSRFESELAQALSKAEADSIYKLKLIVLREGNASGYKAAKHEATTIVSLEAFERDIHKLQSQAVNLQTCQWRLSTQPQLAGIKHLNRLDQVMAAKELSAECFEGLMLDQAGNIAEGTMSNVFLQQQDGSWVTPKLEHAGVKGVMREHLLKTVFPSLGIACQEATIGSLSTIQSVFISNALMGIVPVASIDDHRFRISADFDRLVTHVNKTLIC